MTHQYVIGAKEMAAPRGKSGHVDRSTQAYWLPWSVLVMNWATRS
jgi:hypothetical protein